MEYVQRSGAQIHSQRNPYLISGSTQILICLGTGSRDRAISHLHCIRIERVPASAVYTSNSAHEHSVASGRTCMAKERSDIGQRRDGSASETLKLRCCNHCKRVTSERPQYTVNLTLHRVSTPHVDMTNLRVNAVPSCTIIELDSSREESSWIQRATLLLQQTDAPWKSQIESRSTNDSVIRTRNPCEGSQKPKLDRVLLHGN